MSVALVYLGGHWRFFCSGHRQCSRSLACSTLANLPSAMHREQRASPGHSGHCLCLCLYKCQCLCLCLHHFLRNRRACSTLANLPSAMHRTAGLPGTPESIKYSVAVSSVWSQCQIIGGELTGRHLGPEISYSLSQFQFICCCPCLFLCWCLCLCLYKCQCLC